MAPGLASERMDRLFYESIDCSGQPYVRALARGVLTHTGSTYFVTMAAALLAVEDLELQSVLHEDSCELVSAPELPDSFYPAFPNEPEITGFAGTIIEPVTLQYRSDCILLDGFECPLVPVPEGLSVAGLVLDYWTLSPVPDALVVSLSPPLIDISNGEGEYVLEGFDVDNTVAIRASRAPSHRETNNAETMVGDQSVNLDVFVAAESDLARQFALVGIVQQHDAAIVVAEMQNSDGSALEGVPLADVLLTDDSMLPIGDGPYYFGSTGDIVDPAILNVSTAYPGRGARVAFLNVPMGNATLSVSLPSPETPITVVFVAEQDIVQLLVVK
jgi:hypothetical protein